MRGFEEIGCLFNWGSVCEVEWGLFDAFSWIHFYSLFSIELLFVWLGPKQIGLHTG
jgi:hypothetical protein